ncbi:glycosyltransferase [Streptomyces sp. NPDC038707]|uniref:glycosyltransferase n=1 Tax=Streptomyces sp. NPDC038707 TaxID=3154329 RepID=UPI0033D933CF
MRLGLLTEGGYPYVGGDAGLWCERLVRGLEQHEFDVYALGPGPRGRTGDRRPLPAQVRRVRTAPPWPAEGARYGRPARRRFAECYAELVGAVCTGTGAARRVPGGEVPEASGDLADRFGSALYGLAELAREQGGLTGALRSETAVRALERACRAPRALCTAHEARVPDLLTIAAHLERALRPLSLDWYDDDALGAADLCHATTGGAPALCGLLARHFCGVPLLVTEYTVHLRTHYLTSGPGTAAPAVRAVLAAFHGRLAAEVHRAAELLTAGDTQARRWQERCGADRARIRTVYPGTAVERFAEPGEPELPSDPDTLVWAGPVDPAKDLVTLLHAFAEVRREEPKARLRVVGTPSGTEGAAHLGHCRALAARLFPGGTEGDQPVSFEETGEPDAYAAATVVVLSSRAEGFPAGLVEAMLSGRATVSTDVGAVVEVIGGTGLVVPPGDPTALAEACVALLRDPGRRARLGAAARARALELFTVERNIAAFHGLYLEIVSHYPVRRAAPHEPRPFAAPAETLVPGHRAGPADRALLRGAPAWATDTTQPSVEETR